jgi:hypothetical protein
VNELRLARRRDLGDLFRDSLSIYTRHFWTFVALSAVVVVPASLIVSGIGLQELTGSYDSSPTVAETTVPTLVSFLVVAPLVTAICIYALRHVAEGRSPGAGESIVAGFEAFAPVFFAVLLMAAGIALGLLLFIVPGVYVAVRWFFVPQAVVLGDARGTAALADSYRAVEGFWWRTFALVVLAQIAVAIPALALAAPFVAISEGTDRAVWALIGSMVAETITTPFAALFSTLLWYDLRARGAEPSPA